MNRESANSNGSRNGETQHSDELPRVARAADLHGFPSAMPLGQFLFEYLIAAVFATVSEFQGTSRCRLLPGSRNRKSEASP
jgi:hypothetical protein